MAKQKYYVVKIGKQPGIYRTWAETEAQVKGFSGASYKSFGTLEEAEQWQAGKEVTEAKSAKKATPQKQPLIPQKDPQVPTDRILLYTDGGSRNTGTVKGGHVRQADLAAWAYLLKKDDQEYSQSGGEFGATNNRMELTALWRGLETALAKVGKDAPITVISDSKYILNAITKKWLAGWQRRGWKKSTGAPVANQELWQQIAKLLPQFTDLQFLWTKGHATNQGNIFVDHKLNKMMDYMEEKGMVPVDDKLPK